MVVCAIFNSVFADSCLALSERILPLDLNDSKIGIPLANGRAVIIRQNKPASMPV